MALTRLARGLAPALAACALTGAARAQDFTELPNGPACVEQWIAHVRSVLNGYAGDAEFNANKPWSINQYGVFTGTNLRSNYEPDTWAASGADKHRWMWDNYTTELQYPDWNNPNFNAAGLKGLRWFVRGCAGDAGGVGGSTAGGGGTGAGTGGDPLVALDTSATCPANFDMHKGSTLTIICYCAPDALTGAIWGTEFYTSDSALCNAAVHSGAVGSGGGMIVVRGAPGRDSYQGTSSNGVASDNYTGHDWSFTFPGYDPSTVGVTSEGATACPSTMAESRGTDTVLTCHCASGALGGRVWGTDVYTDDSAVCAAALHAGVIGTAGGSVTVVVSPGLERYTGSERNGVASGDYNQPWHGSFHFQ